MADHSPIQNVLARQRAERERLEEERRQEEESARHDREVWEAFGELRYCTEQSLTEGTVFYREFAGSLARLASLLEERGELAGLLENIERPLPADTQREKDARLFVAQLTREAQAGELAKVVEYLKEAVRLPFLYEVNEWLRRKMHATFHQSWVLARAEDGVCWPHLLPGEPDPLAILEQGCAVAARVVEDPPTQRPSPESVVNGLWQLAREVAARFRRSPAVPPASVPDDAAALAAVEAVRGWAAVVRANPHDPVAEMREAIRQERLPLELLSGSSTGVDWQSGIDRLWERWRSLFPLIAPPPRPAACRTYQQASDAVDALLRVIEERWGAEVSPPSLRARDTHAASPAGQGEGQPKEEERPMTASTTTFGELLAEVERAESVFPLNQREIDRIRADEGPFAAGMFEMQVAALGARPCLREQPGGEEVELACDEIGNGEGVTVANLRRVRVRVCREHHLSLSELDKLPLSEVAALLSEKTPPKGESPVTPPAAGADQGKAIGRMTREEANKKALELAEKDQSFVHLSQREWADAIGCSVGLVSELPLWQRTMERTGRGKKGVATVPKAVSFTDHLEAVTGEGEKDEELHRLIAEQKRDHDPSPLEDDPPDSPQRHVRCRKRL